MEFSHLTRSSLCRTLLAGLCNVPEETRLQSKREPRRRACPLNWSAGRFRARARRSAASPTRQSGDLRALRCKRYHVRNRPAGPRSHAPVPVLARRS